VRIKRGRTSWGKVLLLLTVLLVGGISLTGCYGRGQPRGWSGATVSGDSIFVGSIEGRLVGLNKSDGSFLWSDEGAGTLGTSKSKVAIYGTPAVAEDLVYVGGYNGKVYALVASTGALRWVYPREGNLDSIIGGIVASQGKVYFSNSGGKVYALDALTGDKLWSFETGDKIWSTPTVEGGMIYVSSFDKKLYALSAADGSKQWEFEVGSTIMTTPLVYEDKVYIGSFDRHVYAVDASNGSEVWRSEVEGGKWFWTKPTAHNSVIYAPNLDGRVYMFDAQTGSEIAGAVDLGSPISSAPVVVGNKVIIATEEGKVYSLDSGSKQPSLLIDVGDNGQKVLAPLSASDGIVYIKAQTSSGDRLYAVNVETQAMLWSQSLLISEGD